MNNLIGNKLPLILASSSSGRQELMSWLKMPFTVISPDVDEAMLPEERAEQMVQRLALKKARRVAESCPSAIIIGADTTVVLDGVIYGKPSDADDAKRMLQSLSGKEHTVFTGMALVAPGAEKVELSSSQVLIAGLSAADIDRYLAHGDWLHRAGAYAFQGSGVQLISNIEGSPSSIIGLNLCIIRRWLEEVNYENAIMPGMN